MAKTNNVLMKGARGAINKQVVFRVYGDQTIVSAYPDMSRRTLSPAQKNKTLKMTIANEEVSRIKADKQLREQAQIRLNVTSEKLHHALLKEELLKLSGVEVSEW